MTAHGKEEETNEETACWLIAPFFSKKVFFSGTSDAKYLLVVRCTYIKMYSSITSLVSVLCLVHLSVATFSNKRRGSSESNVVRNTVANDTALQEWLSHFDLDPPIKHGKFAI